VDAGSARRDLEAWRASFPVDPYAADAPLQRLVGRSAMDDDRRRDFEARMSAFARQVVAEVGPAAVRYEHRAHLPELVRYDELGNRVERVEFDPAYHHAGAVVWDSGVVADSGTPGRAYEQATLLYLLSLEGEAGHACPATCTIGLARALRRRAAPAVRDRFLPALLERDYGRAERGAQFVTEVQGGSDVGANTCEAVAVGDGTWRVSGEKWFCSVADADQFLVTARPVGAPAGTAGLGCFVVPRRVEGAPNGFALRRLKEKLGTRGLASGEIDFDAALAWPIGPIEEGFRTTVGIVLNTSRWLTAVGSAGMMRRAYLEAAAYTRHRRAFDRQIGTYPAVRATLASMKTAALGCLHLWWLLTSLEDRIDAGTATDEETGFHRFLVNAAKYAASVRATQVVRDGIEILGGNGTIEDFSILPRLSRDSIVYESWEGTHNVLVAQVLRDLARFELVGVVADRLDALIARATSPTAAIVSQAAKESRAGAEHSIDDPTFGALHFRGVLDRWLLAFQAASLLGAGPGTEEEAAGEMLALESLDPEYRPAAADPHRAARIDATLAGEADA
jgi:alkylation response protein AidB-like acyl-CoA dehydrogenase